MTKTITITVPEDIHISEAVGYVRKVAQQIEEGYTSGHVPGVDQHWEASPL